MCQKAFGKNYWKYSIELLLAEREKTVELVIGLFQIGLSSSDGAWKLKDLRIAKQNRGSVFDEIIIGSTTYETLAKSRYLPQIENRFEPLALIEQLLDDNRLVFRYNAKLNQFSLIEADYLLSTPLENSDIYNFYCRTQGHRKIFLSVFLPEREERLHRGTAALYHAL